MKRIILVDGNSLMYRAYYGFGDPSKMRPNSKGIYTNACNAFIRMIHNLINKEDYDNILIAFDKGKHTFRHEIQADYKAGRSAMPDEMRMQIAYLKDFLKRANIAQLEIQDYEADDIIGTMSYMALQEGYHCDIYSSDKDLLQLVSENSTVHMTIKGMSELEDYTLDHFKEVYGITPTQFIDLKALMGDKSDNISGVPGIGPKKGIKLLQTYDSVEGILENVEQLSASDKAKFLDNKELVLTCKKMVTILRNAPIGINLEDTAKKEANVEELKELYEYLELNGLIKELKSQEVTPDTHNIEYKVVQNNSDLLKCLQSGSAIYFETLSNNYHKENPICIAVRNQNGIFIVPSDVLSNSNDAKLFFSDSTQEKHVFDYKKSYVLSKKLGLTLNGVTFDMLLASYVINPSFASHEFKTVAQAFNYYDVDFDESIYGKGVKKKVPDNDILYNHVAKKVNALYLLKNQIKEKVKAQDCEYLLYNVELPLSRVLAEMEMEGVTVDLDELNRQKSSLKERIDFIELEIYRLCGEEFNIQSPKQLGVVLFEHLNLPCSKKTKTGYSTNQEILEGLIGMHPVIEYILTYRQLSKLYQTYIEGLTSQIYSDNKVHTIYEQALTETGRLSSIEPNLQNIPVRSEEGKNIRKFFVPNSKGDLFLSCDYSQIELRVLAHMANVSKLIEAFNNNVDVHSSTAANIFNVAVEDVTSDLRRKAKAVNFGIIYGLSAYGLAQETGFTNKEAQNFINKYYELYPEIKTFMDSTVEFCKANSYVKTILDRRRYIPDINSNNHMVKEFAKRTAMNAPIQGSAADIIKMAMVKLYEKLESGHYQSKLLLQIHDELILEVKPEELDEVTKLVEETMDSIIELKVKLEVSKDIGHTLYEV